MRTKQPLLLRDDLVRHVFANDLEDNLPQIVSKAPAVNGMHNAVRARSIKDPDGAASNERWCSPLLHMLEQPLICRVGDPLHPRFVSKEAPHYRI